MRAEARRRRALAQAADRQRTVAAYERVMKALSKSRQVLADDRFIAILRSRGIQTLPQCCAMPGASKRVARRKPPFSKNDPDDVSLEFVIAWRFLFPLFSQPAAKAYFEKTRPGFILEMKDAFIALVMEGPFTALSRSEDQAVPESLSINDVAGDDLACSRPIEAPAIRAERSPE